MIDPEDMIYRAHAIRAFAYGAHAEFSASTFDGQLGIAQLCRLNDKRCAEALYEALPNAEDGKAIERLIAEALDVHCEPAVFLQQFRDVLLTYLLECALARGWNLNRLAMPSPFAPRDPVLQRQMNEQVAKVYREGVEA